MGVTNEPLVTPPEEHENGDWSYPASGVEPLRKQCVHTLRCKVDRDRLPATNATSPDQLDRLTERVTILPISLHAEPRLD